MTTRTSARLALISAALLFSTGGAAIKATSLTGWQVASFRSGIAALALLLLLPAARRGWTARPWLVAISYAFTLVLFVLANKLTTSANTIFLQSAAPLYLAVLGPLLLRERVRRDEWWLMVVIGVGLVICFRGESAVAATAPDPVRGNVLALFSGVTFAFMMLGLRWISRREGDKGIAAVTIGNLLACLTALPMALPVAAVSTADLVILLYLGVFQIGVAYVLVTRGLQYVPVLEASLLLLVEPVLNPVWSWLVHGEQPGPGVLAGGLLILAAAAVLAIRGARSSDPVPLPEAAT